MTFPIYDHLFFLFIVSWPDVSFGSQANIETEQLSIGGAPYGVNGYRSDCRYTPFNGVVTFDHGVQPPLYAVFLQRSGLIFTAELSTGGTFFLSGYNPPKEGGISGTFERYGLWDARGYASGSFQFGVCASNDVHGFGVGFFFSGSMHPLFAYSSLFSTPDRFCFMSIKLLFFIAGYSNCWKSCDNWCGDSSSGGVFRTQGPNGCWRNINWNVAEV
jgi:hypothetical protein